MNKAIVTGGAGFAGYSLVRSLLERGYRVVCPVRPGSSHNVRLEALKEKAESEGNESELILVNLDMKDIRVLESWLRIKGIDMSGCLFFHLAWVGERDNFDEQYANVAVTVDTVVTASLIKASGILITGSQAEYGIKAGGTIGRNGKIMPVNENDLPDPVNAYGAAKTAAMYLSRDLSRQLGISWNWLRIFSLYGEYEHPHTMLSYLKRCLKKNVTPSLSSCSQSWDYLNVRDAADAMIAVAEKGRKGEIYNIANGTYRPLKEFTEKVREAVNPGIEIDYAPDDILNPALSLRPSVDKLKKDTGFQPKIEFNGDLS